MGATGFGAGSDEFAEHAGRRTGCVVALARWGTGGFGSCRVVLRYALSGLGYDGEAVIDAVLALSELVANAVEHAVGPYELRLRCTASHVICEVVDHDPRILEILSFAASALFGL
ncbi:ATP-binding protein [Streptomyces malaysiensis]|uniref:ATP-binding protein n=1 Tax=Streptomyces malaysiensis TaxID=92644 RepID=UPI0033EA595F